MTEDAADGFRLAMAVDLPVEARDAEDLADDGLLDDCAGAAGADEELAIGVALLVTGFVALLAVLTVDDAGVVGVLPGTGFSLRLLTFCCWTLSLPTFGSFRTAGVGVRVRSSSKEMVSGNFSSSSRFSLSSKEAALKVST